jgi:sRNA-binding regulator protein Hfq
MTKRIARDTSSAIEVAAPAASMAAVMDPPQGIEAAAKSAPPARKSRGLVTGTTSPKRFAAAQLDEPVTNRQAELFYLQKQIQLQTQMIFVMEDGARIQGVVEWYDRHSIKVRGKSRVLIYKSAIKYLYKAGEIGTAPGE